MHGAYAQTSGATAADVQRNIEQNKPDLNRLAPKPAAKKTTDPRHDRPRFCTPQCGAGQQPVVPRRAHGLLDERDQQARTRSKAVGL